MPPRRQFAYVRLLQIELHRDVGPLLPGVPHAGFQLTAPGVVIGLHPSSNVNLTGNSGNVSIGFTTDNIGDAKAGLQKLSIKTTDREEEGGQFLHFTDPDGTALYFIKPKW